MDATAAALLGAGADRLAPLDSAKSNFSAVVPSSGFSWIAEPMT